MLSGTTHLIQQCKMQHAKFEVRPECLLSLSRRDVENQSIVNTKDYMHTTLATVTSTFGTGSQRNFRNSCVLIMWNITRIHQKPKVEVNL